MADSRKGLAGKDSREVVPTLLGKADKSIGLYTSYDLIYYGNPLWGRTSLRPRNHGLCSRTFGFPGPVGHGFRIWGRLDAWPRSLMVMA